MANMMSLFNQGTLSVDNEVSRYCINIGIGKKLTHEISLLTRNW
jgi:hypothetical protein